jgi:hypothetical protein
LGSLDDVSCRGAIVRVEAVDDGIELAGLAGFYNIDTFNNSEICAIIGPSITSSEEYYKTRQDD